MKIFSTLHILKELDDDIQTKTPFSLMRLGDGGLKYIHAVLFNDTNQLQQISDKEGIPLNSVDYILDLWKTSSNLCDYIDSSQVYYTDFFWERVRKGKQSMSPDTIQKMQGWLKLYRLAGFTNEKFCNPEINFLSCLDIYEKSLLEIIKDKKICCITSCDENKVKEILWNYDISVLQVANQTGNQFKTSFNTIIKSIDKIVKDYDIWLIAAGELGRIYTGLIKFYGGIAFDIGSLIDYWCSRVIPVRLKWFIQPSEISNLKLSLTEDGEMYKEYLLQDREIWKK